MPSNCVSYHHLYYVRPLLDSDHSEMYRPMCVIPMHLHEKSCKNVKNESFRQKKNRWTKANIRSYRNHMSWWMLKCCILTTEEKKKHKHTKQTIFFFLLFLHLPYKITFSCLLSWKSIHCLLYEREYYNIEVSIWCGSLLIFFPCVLFCLILFRLLHRFHLIHSGLCFDKSHFAYVYMIFCTWSHTHNVWHIISKACLIYSNFVRLWATLSSSMISK